jgi:hypothetical protein
MAKRWDNPKDPDEVVDYAVDWRSVLTGGDVIVTSTWTLPTGIVGGAQSFTDTQTTIWLQGGTDGVNYDLLNRITTQGGRTWDQTCTLRVRTK